jgi:hypothetical protein
MVTQQYCLCIAMLVACGTAANAPAIPDPLSSNKSNQPPSYRAMVYSPAFAQKYTLPQGGIQSLDPGLQAVVLRVVERPNDHPGCFLDLYLDDTLELAFPEGSEGVHSKPDDENPLFFVHNSALLGAENHRWDTRLGSFHARACHQTPQRCLDEQSGPCAYARHLVPGCAFQAYAISCSALDPERGPTEMWLLRAGRDAKDLYAGTSDESATYRFAMPAALFEHAAQRVRQAVQFYAEHPLGPEPPRGQFTVPGAKSR